MQPARPPRLPGFLHLPLLAAALLGCLLAAPDLAAQQGSILGIVTDAASGQPLNAAVITVEAGGEELRSAGSDRNGLYLIGGMEAGSYTVRFRALGYAAHEQAVVLTGGERATVNARLVSDPVLLQGVEVTLPAGAVVRDLGAQRITPVEMARVPTPAGSADLASYLQTLPGVVSTGDRGGHLFVRGGTHTENITLMDGLMIYQPFHIIGFFSAFPEDLVSSVDFYAGGFGARYSGRTSSVMDVRMRDGNRNRYEAAVAVSPFIAEGVVEGPLERGRLSWIGSFRRSLIEETSRWLPGEEQPLGFDSQYLKVTSSGAADSRCSAMALRTSDRGRLDVAADDSHVGWSNVAIGGRCTSLFEEVRSFLELTAGYSSVRNETVIRGSSDLYARTSRLHAELSSTHLVGAARIDAGYRMGLEAAEYNLTELFGRQRDTDEVLNQSGFVELSFEPLGGVTLAPGVVATLSPRAALEPRIRGSWRPRGVGDGELSGAAGVYFQDLAGISDVRDAGSVFVAWMSVPEGRAMRSVHSQLGWQQRHPGGVQWAIEGYHRSLSNVGVPLWGTVAEFTTELGLANGRVYGGDVRAEYFGGRAYGFLGYGLSWTEYESAQESFNSWFGEPVQRYHPPHDRRHQINAVGGMELGRFTARARWQLASGLPFTRPLGFDEAFDYRFMMVDVRLRPGDTRMIVEKPYLGRLPLVHRLDLSVERVFALPFGHLELQAGAINAYDRANMFYYDLFTHRRVDQLPIVPYLSVKLRG